MAPIADYARKALAAGKADVVVAGHSHHPVMETHPAQNGPGLYINTGDWLYHQSYVEWDGERFAHRSFGGEEVPRGESDGGGQGAEEQP